MAYTLKDGGGGDDDGDDIFFMKYVSVRRVFNEIEENGF
jgi:hypothetical protein